MTISIIIAVKAWQKNLEECVNKCQELDFSDFEIIILPDEPLDEEFPRSPAKISIFPTGQAYPAKKRDLALKYAKGEILAFIDDDAYPRKDWLKNAMEDLKDESIAAVGGPAVTALNDTLLQKASGRIYSSILVSGSFIYRYLPCKRKEVDDIPSCNFIMRKSVMQDLGGFNTRFWPGEDTKLCLDITKRLKKKIIYDPQVLVYHHRRPLFLPHLKQVANYGLHRGYFVKKYPGTSLKFSFFLPSFLLFGLLVGAALSLFFTPIKALYLSGVLFYLFLVFIFSISKELRLIPLVFFGIIFTHITYGAYFLKGLFANNLKEES